MTTAIVVWTPQRYTQYAWGCWLACLAGLTGIPHRTLCPCLYKLAWEDLPGTWRAFDRAVKQTLARHGWRTYARYGADDQYDLAPPAGYAIAVGRAARGHDHAVIVRDGVLWHDPHPDRTGLTTIICYEVVERVDQR